ncbi:MAG: putative multicopper oxidase [Herbinix sp.]|jgi:FtsP/CotA-like multicopper oxidase with cupredoxin domain|nr:putative multicopper oxidase [Herbinix sp.]
MINYIEIERFIIMLRYLLGYLFFYIMKFINHIEEVIQNKTSRNRGKKPVQKLDPSEIPKYENQLDKPPVYLPIDCKDKTGVKSQFYFIDSSEFYQQLLPKGFPMTKVYGYGGIVEDKRWGLRYRRSSPGATLEAVRNTPVKVKWINNIKKPHLLAVDPTVHWANPNKISMDPPKPWPDFPPGFMKAQKNVPIATHLHGGEVESIFDGHPDAWYTHNRKKGPAYRTNCYTYPNQQDPTTLWYHDHALGITRLNVYAGLAGFYLLRDKESQSNEPMCPEKKLDLPKGKYEIPLVIQDRSFYTDGSLLFPSDGINADIHPYWNPEFFGDIIMVNGKVWPELQIERRQYRLRILNGSNARFYNFKFSNGMSFIQIGSDGGLLPKPVLMNTLLLAPAERADILVDFSHRHPGEKIQLLNDAKAPYPDGDDADPETVGQIMQFSIPMETKAPVRPPKLPEKLNRIPRIRPNAPTRYLTLNEVMGPNGPVMVLLDGKTWSDPITEYPKVGSTEEWCIMNLTMDTHPIHLHLVQFQLKSRQDFLAEKYKTKWEEMNGMDHSEHSSNIIPIDSYLINEPVLPDENEKGWKDTIRMNPGQVTRILVRFAPQNLPVDAVKPGENYYPFSPECGPGYVWHCHILDHEDNEMMRPYKVKS